MPSVVDASMMQYKHTSDAETLYFSMPGSAAPKFHLSWHARLGFPAMIDY